LEGCQGSIVYEYAVSCICEAMVRHWRHVLG